MGMKDIQNNFSRRNTNVSNRYELEQRSIEMKLIILKIEANHHE
jgi:hypothetical protein